MVENYKFQVGDIVKSTMCGSGIGEKDRNKIVKITKLGKYRSGNGYKVEPKIGNCFSGKYNGFIGEETFKLVKRGQIIHELW